MRILHVLDHSIPLHSGYTFRTRAILHQQRALGWETFHLTGPKQGNDVAGVDEVDGLRFYRTARVNGVANKLPVLNQLAIIPAMAKRLSEVIEEVKPDILHAHSPALNGMAALKAGKRHGLPLVYEVRAFWEDAAVDHGTSREWGLRYRATRALETHVLENADHVTTICEGLRSDIHQRGIPSERITVIPNAVDIDKFSVIEEKDSALEQELGLQGMTVLGFLGSFYAYEGLMLLVDAMPDILARRPDTRLLLVGGGPQDDALRTRVNELGLGDKVIFTGRVPHEVVNRYYSLVDLLVYPRLSMRLTELVTPLKPLEAMAQKKLLVASDVGGHKELIRPGETGFLFNKGDRSSLVETIDSAMTAEAKWPAMRDAGRRFVEEERNWAVSVGRYKQIYPGLIA